VNPFRPLRAALFGYEILRVVALLALFAAPDGPPGVPYAACLTANGLFLLMALFLLLDPRAHSGYLTLYGAGKALCLVVYYGCSLAALAGMARDGAARTLAALSFPGGIIRLAGGFLLSVGDILSLAGCRVLHAALAAGAGAEAKQDDTGAAPGSGGEGGAP
jgi:hypothetical protein